MRDKPDPLEAAHRRLKQLWIANTILLVWLAVLSFAVIEQRYGDPEAHEDSRVDQRIDDVTRCLWKLQGDVAKLGVETGDYSALKDMKVEGIAGTGTNQGVVGVGGTSANKGVDPDNRAVTPQDQECPPLAVAPGPR